MDIYAPLAGRMGMQDMRDELEELSFRYINPDAYKTVTERLADYIARNTRPDRRDRNPASANGSRHAHIRARVKSRQKTPWSVFRKMEQKALSFEQLSDIFGFRVIVDSEDDCYRALGAIHREWSIGAGPLQGLHLDAQAERLPSIHTTIVGPSRQRVELQIRTERDGRRSPNTASPPMRLYKEGRRVNGAAIASRATPSPILAAPHHRDAGAGREIRKSSSRTRSWSCSTTRSSASRRRAASSRCRVARRRSISPMRSTPRSAIPAVGCKINGRIAPLMTELSNGDEVEIVTLQDADAARRVGEHGCHRQGESRHPARDPHRHPQAIFRARPPHSGARVRAMRASISRATC